MATALKQIIVAVKGFAVRNKVRRAAVGAAASVALHVCLLLCLIWQNHTGIRGDSGRYDGAHGLGAGYDPVFAQLVSQQVADARTGALITSQVTEPPMLEPSAPADAGSLMQPARAAFPEAEGEAVQTLETGGAAPGTADGQHTLLEQIARCLPPNERPNTCVATARRGVSSGNRCCGEATR